MLQIAVWGIALMLVVKGIDILHRQGVAQNDGGKGAPVLATVGAIAAFLFALGLFALAAAQVSSSPTLPASSFGNP